jgi:hypothetical protein
MGVYVEVKSLVNLRFDDLVVARWRGRDYEGNETDETYFSDYTDVTKIERIGWCDCHISQSVWKKFNKTISRPLDILNNKKIDLERFTGDYTRIPHNISQNYCWRRDNSTDKNIAPNKWHIRTMWYDEDEGNGVSDWAYAEEMIVVINKELTDASLYNSISLDSYHDLLHMTDGDTNYDQTRFEQELIENWNDWSSNTPKVCTWADNCHEFRRNVQTSWEDTYTGFSNVIQKCQQSSTRNLDMLEFLRYLMINYGNLDTINKEVLEQMVENNMFHWATFKKDTYDIFSDTSAFTGTLNFDHECSIVRERARFFNLKHNLNKNSKGIDLTLRFVEEMIRHEKVFNRVVNKSYNMICRDIDMGHLSMDVVRYFSNNAFIDRPIRFDIEEIYA